MPSKSGINRREFMQRSALGGATMSMAWSDARGEGVEAPPVSPNDRITVGMIGVGARAQELMQAIMVLPHSEIVGVCDAYKGRLERAAARTKRRAKVYQDYREILAGKSIDTVLVATPDHWPHTMSIEAVRRSMSVHAVKK